MNTALSRLVCAVLESIPQSYGAPSGHIYALLMGRLSLDQYNGMISALKQCDALKEAGHLLTRGRDYTNALRHFQRLAYQRLSAFESLETHPMLGKLYRKCSVDERRLCEQFIFKYCDLDPETFISHATRWFLDVPTKPKHLSIMIELLMASASKA